MSSSFSWCYVDKWFSILTTSVAAAWRLCQQPPFIWLLTEDRLILSMLMAECPVTREVFHCASLTGTVTVSNGFDKHLSTHIQNYPHISLHHRAWAWQHSTVSRVQSALNVPSWAEDDIKTINNCYYLGKIETSVQLAFTKALEQSGLQTYKISTSLGENTSFSYAQSTSHCSNRSRILETL
jgi:hypothetical protein